MNIDRTTTAPTKKFFNCIPCSINTKISHGLLASLQNLFILKANPFWTQFCYFTSLSLIGFFMLKVLPSKPNYADNKYKANNIDLLFMSFSATTVSSLGSVEMEYFSESQLKVFTLLMLLGGEVFTSMLHLYFSKIKSEKELRNGTMFTLNHEDSTITIEVEGDHQNGLASITKSDNKIIQQDHYSLLARRATRQLLFVVFGYLLVSHILGYSFLLLYLSIIPSARNVLHGKGISAKMFSIFTIVSSFANCGFIPTNENMLVFKGNSGLLLMVMTLILIGNTLYPSCLRLVVWVLNKLTRKHEYDYLLKNYTVMNYDNLFSGNRAVCLALTVLVLILIQLILFCSMEWRSEGLQGLNAYQLIIAGLSEAVNSRHAGESIVDLSTVSPAVLVLIVVMMYLPPSTTFLPMNDCDNGAVEVQKKGSNWSQNLLENLILSPIAYLAIFVVIISITERRQLVEDPLNFSVLNIIFEVVSAFGNVGYSTGYSCERQLKQDSHCKNRWIALSGRMSTEGKITMIIVMVFGRLKKFFIGPCKAWKLA